MAALFWVALALFLYGYAGYPLLLAALARRRARDVAAAPITPSVSLVVSVRDGEALIAEKLANCLALDYPAGRLEILVASDGSTDATNAIVSRIDDPRVRLVAVAEHRGKELTQRAAIAVARGDVLVFTDLGVRLEPHALRRLVANFADPSVGCASGVDRVVNADGQAEGEGAFVRYETLIKRLESRLGSTVGNSGWLFALRRPLCDVWPEGMASDFTMLLRTVRRGFRGVVDPGVVAFARATTSDAREFQRKVRTIVRGMVVLAAHRDMLNPRRHGVFALQLWSHKVCRWLLPFQLLAMLGASAALAPHSAFWALVFAAQVAGYAGGFLLPALRIPRFFVASSTAALVAWGKFLAGERYVTWRPTPRAAERPEGVRPRVCHLIAGEQWAGAEAQVAHLLGGLARGGRVELSAIVFAEGRLATTLRECGVPVTVAAEREGRVAFSRAIVRALRGRHVQVLHAHGYKENILGAALGRLAGVRRFVRTVHGSLEPWRGLDYVKMSLYARVDRALLRWATDRVIAVSADLAARLSAALGERRVSLVRNGIEPSLVAPRVDRAALRSALGLDQDAPVFAAAGRLMPVKGLEHFLTAAPRIARALPAARFVIVGEGPLRPALEAQARALGLGDSVRLPGFRSDVIDVLNAADVFVLPSLHEGLPLVLLEAMALGKPVVASAVGGIPEVLHDVLGWLVPPGEPERLAEACLDAFDAARRQSHRFAVQKRLDEIAEMNQAMCRETESLYHDLVSAA